MSILKASYHNHSTFSDGINTPAEMVVAAREQGLDILGFAEHFYRDCPTPSSIPDWALQPTDETSYFETVKRLAEENQDLEIRIGLEFDWLNDNLQYLLPMTQHPALDYTIGSVHFVGRESIDLSPSYWFKMSEDERNETIRQYWCTLTAMVSSHAFDIVGHLDLYKKFNARPTIDLSKEINDALDAIKAANMTVELNTAGWVKDCKECYPNETLLQACFKREIPVLVSADAHNAQRVAENFNRAYDILARVGYRQLAYYRYRERFFLPLDR
jgi:histidinol-phosphatase (PHP family)